MTALRDTTLVCDRCGACLRLDGHAAWARQQARKLGWSSRGKQDFCPGERDGPGLRPPSRGRSPRSARGPSTLGGGSRAEGRSVARHAALVAAVRLVRRRSWDHDPVWTWWLTLDRRSGPFRALRAAGLADEDGGIVCRCEAERSALCELLPSAVPRCHSL